jgi:hypothetical protein
VSLPFLTVLFFDPLFAVIGLALLGAGAISLILEREMGADRVKEQERQLRHGGSN